MEMIDVMDVNLVLIVVGAALAFGWGFVYFPSVRPARLSWKSTAQKRMRQ